MICRRGDAYLVLTSIQMLFFAHTSDNIPDNYASHIKYKPLLPSGVLAPTMEDGVFTRRPLECLCIHDEHGVEWN